MSAEPLTREEREANYAKSARLTRSERDLIDRYEATVQAAEEAFRIGHETMLEAVRQREAAEEELQDWRDSAAQASGEPCDAYEHHCNDVPSVAKGAWTRDYDALAAHADALEVARQAAEERAEEAEARLRGLRRDWQRETRAREALRAALESIAAINGWSRAVTERAVGIAMDAIGDDDAARGEG